MNSKTNPSISMLLTMALFLAGCETQSSAPKASNPAGNAASPTTQTGQPMAVEIQLNWRPEAEHGGYYAALVHGYYAEEGLDVTIQPGGPEIPVLSRVATGQVAFGVDNADKLIRARAEDADVVAVFSPIQDSPRCLMVHAESGIKSFDDLQTVEGITLSWNPTQPFAIFLQQKLDLSHITMTRYAGSVGPFLLDQKSVQQAYNISEPFLAKQEGAHPVNLMLSEAGFNTYTSLLLCERKTLTEQPELVRKLVRASQRGWQKYLTDAAETNRHIAKLNPEMPIEILDFGVQELQTLCRPGDLPVEEIGKMEAERWETLTKQLEDLELISPGAAPSSAAYTTEFLPTVK